MLAQQTVGAAFGYAKRFTRMTYADTAASGGLEVVLRSRLRGSWRRPHEGLRQLPMVQDFNSD